MTVVRSKIAKPLVKLAPIGASRETSLNIAAGYLKAVLFFFVVVVLFIFSTTCDVLLFN